MSVNIASAMWSIDSAIISLYQLYDPFGMPPEDFRSINDALACLEDAFELCAEALWDGGECSWLLEKVVDGEGLANIPGKSRSSEWWWAVLTDDGRTGVCPVETALEECRKRIRGTDWGYDLEECDNPDRVVWDYAMHGRKAAQTSLSELTDTRPAPEWGEDEPYW